MLINFNIFSKDISKLKLIVLDCDGCMTNGNLLYDSNGFNSCIFCVYDGEGIINLSKKYKVIIISGRNNKGLIKRANDLGIYDVFDGIKDKISFIKKYKTENNYDKSEILAIGDQHIDINMKDECEIFVCPRNTPDFNVIKKSDYITFTNGGEGAIFELWKLLEHF